MWFLVYIFLFFGVVERIPLSMKMSVYLLELKYIFHAMADRTGFS